eukprot:CAMPEP_0178981812 /NCGR_PEP_ID=MMETSP0795-20121207/146_1 /TAXON_ID=88552 /ORGANISM="Amoebophrya sp., Strain Ameob2" /LENGTH=141 /DNA_ID=CAMNT_0020672383 /DNA_START=217 /DNA_END=639 /DNA_ORIENTATION=+
MVVVAPPLGHKPGHGGQHEHQRGLVPAGMQRQLPPPPEKVEHPTGEQKLVQRCGVDGLLRWQVAVGKRHGEVVGGIGPVAAVARRKTAELAQRVPEGKKRRGHIQNSGHGLRGHPVFLQPQPDVVQFRPQKPADHGEHEQW